MTGCRTSCPNEARAARPPADRERGFGVLFTGSSIGGMIAPPLASALYAVAGWRAAFVGTALAGLVWVPVWIWVTRKAKAELDRAPAVEPGSTRCTVCASRRRVAGAAPLGLFALAIPLAASLALLPFAPSPWSAMAILGTAMVGAGAAYTFVTADLLARVPPASVSFASGIMAGAQSLALIIVNPLVGWSVDASGSYDIATISLGCWVVPGSIVWLAWRPRPFA